MENFIFVDLSELEMHIIVHLFRNDSLMQGRREEGERGKRRERERERRGWRVGREREKRWGRENCFYFVDYFNF